MKIAINGEIVEVGGGVSEEQMTAAISGKQDKLTGTQGQVVGFDAEGNAVAQDAGEVYSTQETRIGTWIDGKPLYSKTFNLTAPMADEKAEVVLSNAIPPQSEVISIMNRIYMSDSGAYVCTAGWSHYVMLMYVQKSTGSILSDGVQAAFRGKPLTATIKYTKYGD